MNALPPMTSRQREVALTIARSYCSRTPPNVLREDLEQAALIGAWDAVKKHGIDVQEPLLKQRIRGSIVDELRAEDWLPRRARKAGRAYVVLHGEDTAEFGSNQAHGDCWETRIPSSEPQIDDTLANGRAVERALQALDPRKRKVVFMHYIRGAQFEEIARDIGISDVRICQLHSRAIETMRAALLEEEEKQPVEEVMSEPVPSVLPETGFNLQEELINYRDWMVQQALAVCHGNRAAAARRLGINRTTLVMMLGSKSAPKPKPKRAPDLKPDSVLPPGLAPDLEEMITKVVRRVPKEEVETMRARGMSNATICKQLKSRLGVNGHLLERALGVI